MYDKYSKAALITIGSQIPKSSKGILVSNGTTVSGITVYFYQNGGTTFQGTLNFPANTTTVVPVEIHTIPSALPAGATAFYLI